MPDSSRGQHARGLQSHRPRRGRYAYGNQTSVALWNMALLAAATKLKLDAESIQKLNAASA
jgi:uncharacterized protein YdiU (UPF0061 family)